MIFNEDFIDKKIIHSFQGRDTLNTTIWEGATSSPEIKPEVRKKLLEIADQFIDFLNIELDIVDITMTGSLANYNWSDYSDVDLHIILDFADVGEDTDFIKEFFDSKRLNWNNKRNINVKGFEVELYVQDQNETHLSSGVYSLVKNKWLVKPNKTAEKIDTEVLANKVKKWMKIIDQVMDNLNSDNVDIDKSITDIDNIRQKLKRYRSSGLEEKGEYSYENMVFKYLRRNGYIGKLVDMKDELTDRQLSMFEEKNI